MLLGPQVECWLDVTLGGTVRGLHVRWWENGEAMRHDEIWDDELTIDEAEALVRFVKGTCL